MISRKVMEKTDLFIDYQSRNREDVHGAVFDA